MFCIFFKYSHSCALVGFCSQMHILYILCMGWVLGMRVICIELIKLYVRMFIPSVNEHCSHYFIVITIWSSHDLFLIPFCLIALCLPHMPYKFSAYNDQIVLLCFRSCSYDSRAYQILELGVSEFCSTVPNSHIKSRVCFRVLSQNSQWGRL